MDEYSIKLGRPEDVPAIVGLEARWLAEDSTIGMVPVNAADVRTWLGPFCWVAERAGEIVGFAYATVDRSEGLVGHAAIDWDCVVTAAEPPSRRVRARWRRSWRLPPQVNGVGTAFQPATASSNQVISSC